MLYRNGRQVALVVRVCRLALTSWLVVAACSDDSAIQLSVHYDDAWELSQLRLTARDK